MTRRFFALALSKNKNPGANRDFLRKTAAYWLIAPRVP